jgi:hypothetical protein
VNFSTGQPRNNPHLDRRLIAKIERASADLTPYEVISTISSSNDGYRTPVGYDSGSLPSRQAFKLRNFHKRPALKSKAFR